MSNNHQPNSLTRYAWLSIAAALTTILIKLGAYYLTNSVGLLSDALESLVNLATAMVALLALRIAVRPADEEFSYGYSKVEYFSSGFEGGMILLAAGAITATAIPRLINPQPVEQVALGLAVSVVASAINLLVSIQLRRAGKRYHSITLEADAKHLMTDVLTTGGVLVGVALVAITGWQRLDPIIALLVAANILVTGLGLLRRSAQGLLDIAIPNEQLAEIKEITASQASLGVQVHALRTRSAAARGFVSMHLLVPGEWSVQAAHHLAEQIEAEICSKVPNLSVIIHVEPLEDPASWDDTSLPPAPNTPQGS
jgi:cation diffusion facilitator family transporter